MRVSRIYTSQTLCNTQTLVLEETASHHLSKVLRHQAGDALILFNGDGHQYPAHIQAIDKKRVTVNIDDVESPNTESPLKIHLGIGISKGDRMDWILQKTTELGVTSVTPLLSERTEFKVKGERLEKKVKHWRQIMISACEQCGRNLLPQLAAPTTIPDWTTSVDAEVRLVLHHRSSQRLLNSTSINSAALLIGPEGGLSEDEIVYAGQQGFSAMALGPRILRTETAPLAAIAVLQSIWGDY